MGNVILEKDIEGYRLRKGNILITKLNKNFLSDYPNLNKVLPILIRPRKKIRNLEEIVKHREMKLLLKETIIIPKNKFVRTGLVSSYGTVSSEPMKMAIPNFGLLYIQKQISNPNIDCIYLDPNIIPRRKLNDLIKKQNLDIVGFSVLNATFRNDLSLIAEVKRKNLNVRIVLGGPTIDTFPKDKLFENLGIDYIVAGDGTRGLELISKKILNKEFVDRVVSFPYNTTQRATCTFNILDKNSIDCIQGIKYETAYTEIMGGGFLPFNSVGKNPLRIKISDNCNGACIFCSVSKHKKTPEEPTMLIKVIQKYLSNYDSIEFEDHEFTIYPRRVKSLCDLIIFNNLERIPKQCCTRPDSISPELLDSMKKAGFNIIHYGIESFDQSILDYLIKGTTEKDNFRALDSTIKHGIRPGINLILFSPKETVKSLEKNVLACTDYLKKGATLNIVNRVTVSIGDKINYHSNYKEDVVGLSFFYKGMNKPIFLPSHLKINPGVEKIYNEMLKLSGQFCQEYLRKKSPYVSIHTKSVGYIWALSKILNLPKSLSKNIETSLQKSTECEINHKIY